MRNNLTNEWSRDTSGALINTNVEAFLLHKSKRKKQKEQIRKIEELEKRVEALEKKLKVKLHLQQRQKMVK